MIYQATQKDQEAAKTHYYINHADLDPSIFKLQVVAPINIAHSVCDRCAGKIGEQGQTYYKHEQIILCPECWLAVLDSFNKVTSTPEPEPVVIPECYKIIYRTLYENEDWMEDCYTNKRGKSYEVLTKLNEHIEKYGWDG